MSAEHGVHLKASNPCVGRRQVVNIKNLIFSGKISLYQVIKWLTLHYITIHHQCCYGQN